MTVREATPEEVARWDELVLANPDGGDVWRSAEYASVKRRNRYRPLFLVADGLAITVLRKSVPGLGSYWYLPKGPGVRDAGALLRLLPELGRFAARRRAFAVKLEPRIEADARTRALFERAGLRSSVAVVPNASTILLDIAGTEEEVLARFDKKARYAIKRAGRDGVTVERVPADPANAAGMYALLAATAEGRFAVRPAEYYAAFWRTFEEAGLGQLFFARYEGRRVAGAFAMRLGDRSTYKDGASVRERDAYGASHLLQWEVIRWAREAGCVLHDLCGSPPSDRIGDPTHPHHGIGLFKTSFNRAVTDYVGAYDLVLSPGRYRVWTRFAEKVARRLSLWVRHDPYY